MVRAKYFLTIFLPSNYRLEVERGGFVKLIKPGITLHVQDTLQIDFEMKVRSTSDSVSVEAGAPLLSTCDATVSALIGNRFVDNMPLNGRSFSSLIDLTPGVVLSQSNFYDQGQFSVNGQRPDANYFTVDGVSANFGNLGSGSSRSQGRRTGQLPDDQRLRRNEQPRLAGRAAGVPHPDFDLRAGIGRLPARRFRF